jgi:hypothetical protein
MSEKIYFVQVEDANPDEMEQVVDSLGGFLNSPDADAIAVPKTIKPLNLDEAREYLEGMADALDMEVSDK